MDVERRYLEKISIICGVNPYDIDNLSQDVHQFPKITYGDIVNYLVFERSSYTLEEFKAFKSLDSYNFFLCGWVKDIGVKVVNNYCVVVGKVLHSQRLNEKALHVWIIAKPDGKICSAHCTCVAGLSETCSHVGALLFTIEHQVLHIEERTVTGVKAYWKIPGGRAGEPSTSKDIDYSSVKKLQQIAQGEGTENITDKEKCALDVPEATQEEVVSTLTHLWEKELPSVLHRVVLPFADQIEKPEIPTNIFATLYKDGNLKDDLQTLIAKGENVDISLSQEKCNEIEAMTREQSKCLAWFKFRLGRVTASNFRASIVTKIEKPSVSLLKNICYPTAQNFKSAAMKYGCDHEKRALKDFDAYMQKQRGQHLKPARFSTVGFVINPFYPEIGASPDGLVECECCGPATVEIKCPFCAKDITVEEATSLRNFCLDKNKKLDPNHKYFFQVQMQMTVTGRQMCYFVVWTKSDFAVNIILFDQDFWRDNYLKVQRFHKAVIMPELLGKFYTRQKRHLHREMSSETIKKQRTLIEPQPGTSSESQPSTSAETLYCSCKQPEANRPMIACDNYKDCPVEWYHLDCVGIDAGHIPSVWFCNFCN